MDKEKKSLEKFDIGKKCTKTMHKNIIKGMREVTDGECYFVRRRLKGVTGNGEKSACHTNVKKLVDRIGGEAVYGWKLAKYKELMGLGIYSFVFHSIWKTPEGKCVDVTMCENYGDDRRLVFWHDTKRRANMEEGYTYNNVTVFKSLRGSMLARTTNNSRVKQAVAYWSSKDYKLYMPLKDHKNNGMYRYLHEEYKENREMFEKQFDVKITKNGIKGEGKVNYYALMWDWSV